MPLGQDVSEASCGTLTLGLPSKGRLQQQCADWLHDVGFRVRRLGGDRGYAATLSGLADVEVYLLSPREIALGLLSGDMHVGVTGHDLLSDLSSDMDGDVSVLSRLGFGRADCIVAVPQSWVDVRTMADLDDVAARERRRTGEQLRVATKYLGLTRRFFARSGLADYRIIESHGATEGAPAAGMADVIVDITSTGATLAANHLKILDDGVILRSEAVFAASLHAPWPDAVCTPLRGLLDAMEARERGKALVELRCAGGGDGVAAIAARFGARLGADGRGWLCPRFACLDCAAALRDATGAGVQIVDVEYDFSTEDGAFAAFQRQLAGLVRG